MNEETRSINWLSIFLKALVIVLFIIVVIWLVARLIYLNNGNYTTFEEKMNILKDVASNYFNEESLPTTDGESSKISLTQLVEEEKINNDNFQNCDFENSYIEATKIKDYYSIRIELSCNNEIDYDYITQE